MACQPAEQQRQHGRARLWRGFLGGQQAAQPGRHETFLPARSTAVMPVPIACADNWNTAGRTCCAVTAPDGMLKARVVFSADGVGPMGTGSDFGIEETALRKASTHSG